MRWVWTDVMSGLWRGVTHWPRFQCAGHVNAMKLQAEGGIERFASPAGVVDHAYPDQVDKATAANHSRSFDLKAAIPNLTMPILIVAGDCDPNIWPSRDVAAMESNAKCVAGLMAVTIFGAPGVPDQSSLTCPRCPQSQRSRYGLHSCVCL